MVKANRSIVIRFLQHDFTQPQPNERLRACITPRKAFEGGYVVFAQEHDACGGKLVTPLLGRLLAYEKARVSY